VVRCPSLPDSSSFSVVSPGGAIEVRLPAEERALLDNRSRAGGFKGLSDYVQAAALAAPPPATAPAVTRPRRRKAKPGARGVK
jgi:hypothetical protein